MADFGPVRNARRCVFYRRAKNSVGIGAGVSILTPLRSVQDASLYEDVSSSAKPEVHKMSQLRRRRSEPRPRATCAKFCVKFRRVVSEICEWTDSQTDILIAVLRSFVAASTIWNSLPPALRMCTSPDTFHCHLKTFQTT